MENVTLTRRSVLAASGLAVLAPFPTASAGSADPFRLGVASGDPTSDGMVLWTRLAPRPLAEDGLGGMPGRTAEVEWQLAVDARFSRIVRHGVVTARRSSGFSVHIELRGLPPGREFFYRFRSTGHLSRVGRTRTAPAAGSMDPLTFVAGSCAHYEHGYFTAYRRMADQHPDLVVHLGDYMYEYAPGDYGGSSGLVRKHTGGKCLTLADYRRRHAQYKADPDLQRAHAVAPWAVVFDDHEVEDNWAGRNVGSGNVPGFSARKKAAFQAYYENMPLRTGARPAGRRIQLYRRLAWGSLAGFHLLDTRQYRSDQPCEDGGKSDCDARLDPKRVLAGGAQLRWLDQGLRASTARWNVLAQQVFLAQRDFTLGPVRELGLDGWDGYAADRNRLFGSLLGSGARNPVVLTGDVHTAHAADLLRDFDDPDSERIGIELVTTSIASDGDGYDDRAANAILREENPHIAYVDQRRGFLVCRASAAELTAEFHTLPYISRRNAPSSLSERFTVPDGARSLLT
jgi:alkaline phosphatase D